MDHFPKLLESSIAQNLKKSNGVSLKIVMVNHVESVLVKNIFRLFLVCVPGSNHRMCDPGFIRQNLLGKSMKNEENSLRQGQ